jgi:hypothetical protein
MKTKKTLASRDAKAAAKNVDARAHAEREAAIREEERRLAHEREAKRNTAIVRKRTEAVEQDAIEQADAGPVITITYAGKRVVARPGVLDPTARLSALHAMDVLARAVAHAHTQWLTGRRMAIMAGRPAGDAPSAAWTTLLEHTELLTAQKCGTVERA